MEFLHVNDWRLVLAAFAGHNLVALELGAIIAGCVLGFSSQKALAAPSGETSAPDERATCSRSLNDLVSYLEETAQIEGKPLRVERKTEGAVVLHYVDFLQHMQCREGTLNIDVRDPR